MSVGERSFVRRYLERFIFFLQIVMLSACAMNSPIPLSSPPFLGNDYPKKLAVGEPLSNEVVVVVNTNIKMVHAGMFAGSTLLDPAGSYEGARRQNPQWSGISLQDYIRFQLDDGPSVRLYRFLLSPEQFAKVKARVDKAGGTMPLFCAARVQNIISGITPFESVPDVWLVSPSALANRLDVIIRDNYKSGACYWPNGDSCYLSPEGLRGS